MSSSDDTGSLVPFKTAITFQFDSSADAGHVKDFNAEYQKLEGRIERLTNEPTINGQPIVSYIMKMLVEDQDWDEIVVTGKALVKLAELWPEYVKMKTKMDFINFGRENPGFAAWAFGGFANDIEQFIASSQVTPESDV